ncbi:hypothetical protein G6F70_000155 [Rhizopus microsporus]|nr:hypothetical protein G6F71_001916 [Rhizopus microsporus]KAG1204849.1 hypothetical protein G6F70_000155 [Rhizopus microsporus]KAG1216323.1 hypothetical protein G6F69_000241 [Rhizopus microsporus]KAG1238877.1 hypothetical protein G6F67_000111 [Rhizopus microsporus]KAG1269621.1 hypothetical protein G6F68_000146 [Rhizopus microsporus]
MNRYNKNGFAVEEDNNSAILDFSDIEQQPMLNDQDETIYNDSHTPANRPKAWKQLFPRLLLFIIIGVVSLLFSLSLANSILDIGLPRTLEDVQAVAVKLDNMLSTSWTGYESVTIVFAVLYLWQQAFSIPGSVLLNLLAGYLYGIVMGTIWTSLLTAGGATLAYGLAILVGEPLIQLPWINRRAEPLRRQLEHEKRSGSLFWWLLFIRLFPFSPYWFINLVSPLLGIPVSPFFWSTFFGVLPYNFVCAQAGDVLGDLTSTSDIVSVSLVFKLMIVSLVSLLPIVWGKKIQKWARRTFKLASVDDDDAEKTNEVELNHRTPLE